MWKQLPGYVLPEGELSLLREAFANVTARKAAASGMVSGRTAVPAATLLEVLDARRANNINIVKSRMATPAVIAASINNLNIDKVLTVDHALQLLSILPREDEVEALRSLEAEAGRRAEPGEGPRDLLRDAERFACELMDVPRVGAKLQVIVLGFTVSDIVHATRETLRVLAEGTRDLVGSHAVRFFLDLVLAVGNELNAGSVRGGAQGFELSVLATIDAVKSSVDTSKSLLEHLVTLAWRQEGGRELLTTAIAELTNLPAGDEGTDALSSVNMQLDQLSEERKMVRTERDASTGPLRAVLEQLETTVDAGLAVLDAERADLQKLLAQVLTYFNAVDGTIGDVNKAFDVLSILNTLGKALGRCQDRLVAREKEKERAEAKARIGSLPRKGPRPVPGVPSRKSPALQGPPASPRAPLSPRSPCVGLASPQPRASKGPLPPVVGVRLASPQQHAPLVGVDENALPAVSGAHRAPLER